MRRQQRGPTTAWPPQAGRPRRTSGWISSSRSTIRPRAADVRSSSPAGDASRSGRDEARWRSGWPSRSVRPATWSPPTSTRTDRQGHERQGQLAGDDQGPDDDGAALQGRRIADQLRVGQHRRCHHVDANGAYRDGDRSLRQLHGLQQSEIVQVPGRHRGDRDSRRSPRPAAAFTAMTEIWSMVIPKNSKHKELAWDFIRTLSARDNAILIALNGNGPVRPSAYEDERLKNSCPIPQTSKGHRCGTDHLIVVRRVAAGARDLPRGIAGRGDRPQSPKDAADWVCGADIEPLAEGEIADRTAGGRAQPQTAIVHPVIVTKVRQS